MEKNITNSLNDLKPTDKCDIIFHIGFPKCASSTLQNEVFIRERGYLGTSRGLPFSQDYASQFKSVSSVGPRFWSNYSQVKKLSYVINNLKNKDFPDETRLILSNEMLSNRNKFNNRPIISFLSKFNQQIWKYGRVKVVLVLRNPAERLASEYAQVSSMNANASQADFEYNIKKKIRKKEKYDYHLWVKKLYQTLGKENVCVLLMEEIESTEFWDKLRNFCQLENLDIHQLLKNNDYKNSNKNSANIWNLKPFDPDYKARARVNSLFTLVWPDFIGGGSLRRKAIQKIVAVYSALLSKNSLNNENHSHEIKLTDMLRTEIQNANSKQTLLLGDLLGKDLVKLGY